LQEKFHTQQYGSKGIKYPWRNKLLNPASARRKQQASPLTLCLSVTFDKYF
jgi:hypothetical protein